MPQFFERKERKRISGKLMGFSNEKMKTQGFQVLVLTPTVRLGFSSQSRVKMSHSGEV